MARKKKDAAAADATEVAEGAGGPKKGKKKLLVIALGVVLLGGGGAYALLGRGGPSAPPPPEPGQVLKLDPITLNLDEGHYLKLGLALQFTTDAAAGGHGGGELDGSQALDLAIDQLSNRKVTELNSADARNKAKHELVEAIEKAYHHGVMDVYFTEFVMQ
jgi:flagellar FliL protein